MIQPSLQSFFFSLPYAMISSLNGTEMNVCIVSVYMEPANERYRSCLYTGRRDARACSEQTSGHNCPGHCAIGRLFAIAIRSRRGACPFNKLFAGQLFANRHLFTWTATNRCLLVVRRMHLPLPRPTLMHRPITPKHVHMLRRSPTPPCKPPPTPRRGGFGGSEPSNGSPHSSPCIEGELKLPPHIG